MTKPVDRTLYGGPDADGRTPFWRMPTLWAAAEGRPRISVDLESLGVLDAVAWFGGPQDVQPTVRRVAQHARDIYACDLDVPIIVTQAGDVLDGAHRIARAHLLGLTSLCAVVLDEWPPPDGMLTEGGRTDPRRDGGG